MAEDVTLSCDLCDFTVTAPATGAGSAAFRLGTHGFRMHGIRSSRARKPRAKAANVPRETSPAASITDGESVGEAYAERVPTDPAAEKKASSGGFIGRLFETKDKEEKTSGTAPAKTAERRPSALKRRASSAEFWGGLVAPAAASGAARAGYVPMARAIVWSSPAVGEIVEDATKGTVVDKVVQPFVRSSEKWENLFDLLGFWGAIGLAQRNPSQADAALGFARKRFVNLLPMIAKNIKAERAKEKAAADAVIDLMPDIRELFPDAADSDDPVGLLMQSLFAPPEAMAEEPSSNGRHAANVS